MTRFDPDQTEAQLLAELRAHWGYEPGERLIVLGQVHSTVSAKGKPLHFLRRLTHPRTGLGFVYPDAPAREAVRAFIPSADAEAFAEQADPRTQWAIAEVELSPKAEREKHQIPHLCNLRRGTLRPLREVPADWSIAVHGAQPARLIAASAHDAILAEAARLASVKIAAHQAQVDAAQAEAKAAGLRLEELQDGNAAAQARLKTTQDQAEAARQNLDYLRQGFEKEQSLMEARLRSLAELVAAKGDRLLALGLIDPDDLAALLPLQKAPARGKSLTEAFGGDFSRLAANVQARLWQRDLIFPQERIRNFLALVRTNDLVILAGDSGSGKTSMVKAVAEAIGAVCTVIAVKPNWTGPEDLIGYFNPVERKYQLLISTQN